MEVVALFIALTIAAGKLVLLATIVFVVAIAVGVPTFLAFALAVASALALLWWDGRRCKRNNS